MNDDSEFADRRDDQHLLGRITQVETKVDRVALTLDHLSENFKTAMETIVNRQEDRWKLIEQRLDMGGREQSQSVRLLTETVARHEQQQAAADTQVDLLGRDHLLLKTRTDSISTDVQDIKGTLRWIARTLAGMVITIVAGIIVFVATHGHP